MLQVQYQLNMHLLGMALWLPIVCVYTSVHNECTLTHARSQTLIYVHSRENEQGTYSCFF